MRHQFTNDVPFLAMLMALACLVVPAEAAAQGCVDCGVWPEDDEYHICEPVDGVGHNACTLTRGGRQCNVSTQPDGSEDCGLLLALDGRGVGVSRTPTPAASHMEDRTALGDGASRLPFASVAFGASFAVIRHACTGAILERSYPAAQVAELRFGLRHVTI